MIEKLVGNETYLDTEASYKLLGISRQTFNANVKGKQVKPERFDGVKKPWYNKAALLALKGLSVRQKATIDLHGGPIAWGERLRASGFPDALTVDVCIEAESKLPVDLALAFDLEPDALFVKRTRKTTIEDGSVVVSSWDAYYPQEYISPMLLREMEEGFELDVVRRIREIYGLMVRIARERYSARLTSKQENEMLNLKASEPVLTLQRVGWSQDKASLLLVSDLVMRPEFFAPVYEYEVPPW